MFFYCLVSVLRARGSMDTNFYSKVSSPDRLIYGEKPLIETDQDKAKFFWDREKKVHKRFYLEVHGGRKGVDFFVKTMTSYPFIAKQIINNRLSSSSRT